MLGTRRQGSHDRSWSLEYFTAFAHSGDSSRELCRTFTNSEFDVDKWTKEKTKQDWTKGDKRHFGKVVLKVVGDTWNLGTESRKSFGAAIEVSIGK